MKKVCENWEKVITAKDVDISLFEEFQERTKIIGAELFHVKTMTEAKNVLINLVKSVNAHKVVAVNCPLLQAAGISEALLTMGVEVYTDAANVRVHCETADIGISGVEFGIAESGSVCLDSYSVESRLVSAMTPMHMVFLNSRNIVKGIADAVEIVSRVFDRGYISFISGPSRTADIERVLTIGVHGPSRFIIIAVDEQINGGVV